MHTSHYLMTVEEVGKGQERADGHTSIGGELSKGKKQKWFRGDGRQGCGGAAGGSTA